MSGLESILYQIKELGEFLDDEQWTEICINKPNEIITEGKGGWTVHEREYASFEWCYNLAKLLANVMVVSLSAETPSLSAVLPGGQRIQVVLPPRVKEGTISITIRKPPAIIMSVDEFIASGAFAKTRLEQSLNIDAKERLELEGLLDENEQRLLELLRNKEYTTFLSEAVVTRKSILISGSTGAGKTTLANAILRFIPKDERIISVEDVPEVKMPHIENLVSMFFSKQTPGGAKSVFEDTLRSRPDRVMPAELRGDESYFFLQNVLNSGHPGAITTCHANRTKLAFMRLALMIQSSPEGKALSYENIMAMLHSLIDVVIQIVRHPDRSRTITEIYYDPAYARKQMG